MKILHTSDWHIGRTLHGTDLSPAISLFCEWLVQTVRNEKIDLLLVSGDIFDRAVPNLHAIEQFDEVILQLSEICTTVLISGNHDSAIRLGSLSPLLKDQLRIYTTIGNIGVPFEFTSTQGEKALIYPIPYLEPDATRYSLGRMLAENSSDSDSGEDDIPEVARSHQAVMDAALTLVERDLSQRRAEDDTICAIAMVHAFITGGQASDSERYIAVGGVEDVRSGSFDLSPAFQESACRGLDYVAAGHLHRPQNIAHAQMPIRYSGSPVAYSFSEAGCTKSITIVETLPTGQIQSIKEVATPVWRPIAVLEGTLAEILAPDNSHLRDHFLSITVTDDERPAQLNATVRSVFPYALLITHRSERQVNIDRSPALRTHHTDEEICTTFFEEIGGRELTDQEKDTLSRLFTELRVEGSQA